MATTSDANFADFKEDVVQKTVIPLDNMIKTEDDVIRAKFLALEIDTRAWVRKYARLGQLGDIEEAQMGKLVDGLMRKRKKPLLFEDDVCAIGQLPMGCHILLEAVVTMLVFEGAVSKPFHAVCPALQGLTSKNERLKEEIARIPIVPTLGAIATVLVGHAFEEKRGMEGYEWIAQTLNAVFRHGGVKNLLKVDMWKDSAEVFLKDHAETLLRPLSSDEQVEQRNRDLCLLLHAGHELSILVWQQGLDVEFHFTKSKVVGRQFQPDSVLMEPHFYMHAGLGLMNRYALADKRIMLIVRPAITVHWFDKDDPTEHSKIWIPAIVWVDPGQGKDQWVFRRSPEDLLNEYFRHNNAGRQDRFVTDGSVVGVGGATANKVMRMRPNKPRRNTSYPDAKAAAPGVPEICEVPPLEEDDNNNNSSSTRGHSSGEDCDKTSGVARVRATSRITRKKETNNILIDISHDDE